LDKFPNFMKNQSNAIRGNAENTAADGFVFDGADGSQLAIWEYAADSLTPEETHDFDEYVLVVDGLYIIKIGQQQIQLTKGMEYTIAANTKHTAQFTTGTRVIHYYGGKLVDRNE
jgi:quercetin dioxygenase-like cupin family protein